ncbi:MAG: proliferating cell nuclear antigen [Methanohalophilus sp. T328-1]|nr:MAG: proliferating cell nuclear antigen [Methanohalophilus sp. T328-1]
MLEATIDASLLKDSIESLSVLVDEARVHISPEGSESCGPGQRCHGQL